MSESKTDDTTNPIAPHDYSIVTRPIAESHSYSTLPSDLINQWMRQIMAAERLYEAVKQHQESTDLPDYLDNALADYAKAREIK